MALKPDRVEHLTDLSFFLDEVAERGKFLIVSTAGSGAAMDDSSAKAAVATAGGDIIIVPNKDSTRFFAYASSSVE